MRLNMGGLSMNPDHDGQTGPRLAREIAEKEEWGGTKLEAVEEPKKEEPPKKFNFGPFELDISYARTFPGLVRIAQVLIMLVSFVCLIIASDWPDQGSYTFFCVFLVFGIFISGYLFFSIIADQRGDACCGFSWIILELGYFILFGFIVFLGSCLAANHSQGMTSLTASAIFGFAAAITFVYFIWTTWNLRKQQLQKKREEEEEKEKENENHEEGEIESQKRPITPLSATHQDHFEMENEFESEHNSRRPSINIKRQNNSLPSRLKEQYYENQEFGENNHRRRHYSASEKDSAYSEGTITPTRGKMIPSKMRRTASAHEIDFDNLSQKQPLTHLSRRPYGEHAEHGSRRRNSTHRRKKYGYGYPRELGTHSFTNMGFNHDGSRFDDDNFDQSLQGQKSLPDWLRAALGTEVGTGDHILDDESEVALPSVKRVSTFPSLQPKEFPLLAHSDEESVNYPSVSQNGPGRQFYTMPNKHHGDFVEMDFKQPQKHQHRYHHSRRKRGVYHHGRRPFHQHRHHHHHHHHHRKMHHHHHHSHRREGGRKPINDEHENYLRRMVENDELVAKDGFSGGKSLRGFKPHNGKPIETGKRRVIPEHPISIHFPEQSRWDDDVAHNDMHNPIMEKYLADAQKLRS